MSRKNPRENEGAKFTSAASGATCTQETWTNWRDNDTENRGSKFDFGSEIDAPIFAFPVFPRCTVARKEQREQPRARPGNPRALPPPHTRGNDPLSLETKKKGSRETSKRVHPRDLDCDPPDHVTPKLCRSFPPRVVYRPAREKEREKER